MSAIPYVLTAPTCEPLTDVARAAAADIRGRLADVGAVLVRGCAVATGDELQTVVQTLGGGALDYVYRSTPRTDLGGGIYTATEYPKGMAIPMHSENAYQREWPLMLCFLCVQPAASGGQTPLADLLRITAQIDPEIRQAFDAKGVTYIRNYSAQIDLPWQTVFQTESQAEVEAYGAARQIAVEWRPSGGLRTRQTCQGLAEHPSLGERVWFNQAHLFHPSALDPNTRAALAEVLAEDEWPRHVTFGDGTAIDLPVLDHIRAAFEREKVLFDWQAGDLLVLDNMRVCHGRAPYRGARRVLAAMAQPYSVPPIA